MNPTLFCLLAVCLQAESAFGDIGETPDQATARYGKPVDKDFLLDERIPNERGVLYSKDGIDIFVYFEANVSVLERYQKRENVRFSQEEVDALLARNGHDTAWKVKDATVNTTHYCTTITGSTGLTASWSHGARTRGLVIYTAKYEAARDDFIARSKALQAQ